MTTDLSFERDRILYLRVTGLFGLFDHRIPFDNSTGLTIVIGDNGVGKTVLLKMLHGLLNGKLSIFESIPFQSLEIKFTGGEQLIVYSTTSESGHVELEFVSTISGCETSSRKSIRFGVDQSKLNAINSYIGESWSCSDSGLFEDENDGETVHYLVFLKRLARSLGRDNPSSIRDHIEQPRPKTLFKALKEKCNVRFIGTDRLALTSFSDDNLRKSSRHNFFHRNRNSTDLELTVEFYAKEIANTITSLRSRYSSDFEKLQGSLVSRLLSQGSGATNKQEAPSEEVVTSLIKRLKDIELKRVELEKLDLLSSNDSELMFSSMSENTLQKLNQKVTNNLDLFSLYVEDRERTLHIFESMKEKLQIFKQRISERYLMKSIEVNSEEGFLISLDNGQKINPRDLSSGEQHQLVMLYELFFRTSPDELLLIDEPEISLHLSWQQSFVDDLKTIFKNTGTEILIATHSAAIIENHIPSVVMLNPALERA